MVAPSDKHGVVRASRLFVLCLGLACAAAHAGPDLRAQLERMLVEGGLAGAGELLEANVYGDDNPANGTEDSRIDMSSPLWHQAIRAPWNMSGGTLNCDGRNRGSAVIVDTRPFSELRDGLVVLTSAHVLYDLESGKRYRSCSFHYMGLGQLPGYQGRVSFPKSRLGGFDPLRARDLPGFGQQDWALLYVQDAMPSVPATGRIQLMAYTMAQQLESGPLQYEFMSYSRSVGGMTISTACHVVESTPNDLGGGGWAGHLLDDCDSEEGASGGGLIAHVNGRAYLVGIRSGAHWDGGRFPVSQFPNGPPAGARWDIRSNTNFSRAVDSQMIAALRAMLAGLDGVPGSEAHARDYSGKPGSAPPVRGPSSKHE